MELQVLQGGQPVIEAGVLKYQPDALAHLALLMDGIKAIDKCLARGRLGQGAQNIYYRRLSRSIGTKKTKDLPLVNAEADVIYRYQV
ncbi:unnamed protein product [marine sediment metagenome]|uniref:Uncharacterized protein n=1 Tax=marine sediment metagenome TaxID=412755 RepID=X1E8G4_9ZZZZ